MRHVIILFFLVLPIYLSGQSASSDSIRRRLLDLQLDLGKEQIQNLDNSPARSELIGLELFLRLMINQSENEYDRFMQETRKLRRNYREEFDDQSFISSLFLFRLHMYRAIGSAQFEKYAVAAKDILKSHQAYKRMLDHHPAHPLTSMARGFFSVLVEQVPDRYGKIASLAGFDKAKQDGFQLLKKAYLQSKGSGNTSMAEAGLLWVLCLWEFNSNDEDIREAWQILNRNNRINDLVLTRYTGLLVGFKTGGMDVVKSILDEMEEDGQMERLSYSYYQRGKHRLFCRQADCVDDFMHFIEKAGQGSYVKSAWLRIGFYWTIAGDVSRADYCFEQVHSQGVALNWNDLQALNETSGAQRPNPELLSLRLLYDGAFFRECLEETEVLLGAGQLETSAYFAEVCYRKARSLEALHKPEKALEMYELILRDFLEVESYHIPKSAFLAAEILAVQGFSEKAISYLDLAAATNKYEYEQTFRRQIQSLRRKLEN
ncbi:MAG: hypothetical protein U9N86_17540 [Bacteroidota bacterium]|nr:hypothetical protein [Bacteroidota bacterium]